MATARLISRPQAFARPLAGPKALLLCHPIHRYFPPNSVLIVEYGYSKVVTAPLDTNGDPIMAQSQDFIRNLPQASGACIDPVTGDFLFDTWGGSNEVIRVSGFATPHTSSVVHSGAMGFAG